MSTVHKTPSAIKLDRGEDVHYMVLFHTLNYLFQAQIPFRLYYDSNKTHFQVCGPLRETALIYFVQLPCLHNFCGHNSGKPGQGEKGPHKEQVG